MIEEYLERRTIYPVTGGISHEMKTDKKITNTIYSKYIKLKNRQSE